MGIMVFNLRDLLGLIGLVALLLLLLVRFGVNEPNYAAHDGGSHENNQGPKASWQLVQVVDGRGGFGGHGGGGIGWLGRLANEGLKNGHGKSHGHSTVGVLHIDSVWGKKKHLGPGETGYTLYLAGSFRICIIYVVTTSIASYFIKIVRSCLA